VNVLAFTIEQYPPSVNHIYRPRRGGGLYLTDEGNAYKKWTTLDASRAVHRTGWTPPAKPKGKRAPTLLVVELYFFSPDWRTDCDNCLKLTLDAISAGIEYNDRYFLPRAMGRQVDKANPRIEVRVFCEEAEE
jgi:Holliday junction resolvase RusA-like endonuclease